MSTPPTYSADANNMATAEIPIEIPPSTTIKIPAATRKSNSTAWWLTKRLVLLTFLCFVAGAVIVASFSVGMVVGVRVGFSASSSPEVTQFLSDMFSNSTAAKSAATDYSEVASMAGDLMRDPEIQEMMIACYPPDSDISPEQLKDGIKELVDLPMFKSMMQSTLEIILKVADVSPEEAVSAMRQWGLDSPANFKRVALEAGFDCTEFAQLIASTPELTQSISKGTMYPGLPEAVVDVFAHPEVAYSDKYSGDPVIMKVVKFIGEKMPLLA